MHFPITIRIASTNISLHAVFELLAFFIGFRYFLYLRRKEGDSYTSAKRSQVIVGAVFGALIGSRLLGSLERPYELAAAATPWRYFMSNKTVVGGFLGGLLGVELVKKIIGEKKASGDLFVYPMILALIIGRVGCFSMGVYEETYGLPSSLPWAMDLGDGWHRHPVTLYEIAFLVLLWIALKTAERNVAFQPGARFKLFMVAYLAFRLVLDFYKPRYFLWAGLSPIQLACCAGLLYYLPYLLRPKKLIAYA